MPLTPEDIEQIQSLIDGKTAKVSEIETALEELRNRPIVDPEALESSLTLKLKDALKPAERKADPPPPPPENEMVAELRQKIEAMEFERQADKRQLARNAAVQKLVSAGADAKTIAALGDRLHLDGTESDEDLARLATTLKPRAPINDTRRAGRNPTFNGDTELTPKQKRYAKLMGFDPATGEFLG